ncbi:MAG: DNA primase [Gemmatimonadales bacterium]|nr:DNA primase [Gemmatimonadales bacterium]
MAPAFSSDIIARVKDETDIVEIVRQHVTLKQAGAVFKGLCPFHKEKTPSFIVTPSRDRFHCFGCGNGGDVITFLMEIEGMSFPEAVEVLARPLDIDLSSWLREDESEGERRSFHRANEAAMEVWRDAFWDERIGASALTYMTERGFSEKVLRDFDVGWAPGGSDWLAGRLKLTGVDEELALQADLLRRGEHGGSFAYFRNRIIFPIKNISRQVAGFGGRVIDQGEPKYLNSADSPYFTKGKLLYGFDASRMSISREKTAILVEGYLDLLAMAQVGISNVVATCGTAFTEDQARLIRRGAPNVLLLFDGDKAGLKAAVRSADVALRAGLEPTIVSLPDGKDPNDIVMEQGGEALAELLRQGRGYVPFLRELADQKGGDRQLKERALRQALKTVAGISDPLRREYVLQEAGEAFGMGTDLLRKSVAKEADSKNSRSRFSPGKSGGRQNRVTGSPDPAGSTESAEKNSSRIPGSGPRVKRAIGVPNVARQEAEMLAHVLKDQSGQAAIAFLAERGDLRLKTASAGDLVSELEAWSETGDSASRVSPQEFVLDRWNTAGDSEYRGFVSRLLEKEENPDQTDFLKVIRDCLGRLRRSQGAGQG